MKRNSSQSRGNDCCESNVESLAEILPRLLEQYGISDEQAVPVRGIKLDIEVELELVA